MKGRDSPCACVSRLGRERALCRAPHESGKGGCSYVSVSVCDLGCSVEYSVRRGRCRRGQSEGAPLLHTQRILSVVEVVAHAGVHLSLLQYKSIMKPRVIRHTTNKNHPRVSKIASLQSGKITKPVSWDKKIADCSVRDVMWTLCFVLCLAFAGALSVSLSQVCAGGCGAGVFLRDGRLVPALQREPLAQASQGGPAHVQQSRKAQHRWR